MSTPVWTRIVRGTVDWDRYPIGTMARESWAADVPDASPWVKGPDGWRSTRAPMETPGSADEVLLPPDEGINLDEIIRSMGWSLDDQEMDDMRRLCRAVLASAVRTPVFNVLGSVEPELHRCSSLGPDDRAYDLVFKFNNEADLLAGYAEWMAQRSARNSDQAVEYQFRVHYDENTVTPGWDRWKSCDEAKFNEINGYITMQRESMGRSVYETRLLYTSPDRRELLAAKDTLKVLGYSYNGGERWRPPLGPKPQLDMVEKLDDLCQEFGCPPGINRFEFLRFKLRKACEKATDPVPTADLPGDLPDRVHDALEEAYWNFDARRKGYFKGRPPEDERTAFKTEVCTLMDTCGATFPSEQVGQAGWQPADQFTGRGGTLQPLHSQSYHRGGAADTFSHFPLSIKTVPLLPAGATERQFVRWILDALNVDAYGKVLVLSDELRRLFPADLPVWLRFSSVIAPNEGVTLNRGQLLDGFVVNSDTVCKIRL